METISQTAALKPELLADGDACRFWRNPRLGGLEGLHARFTLHRYPRHTHDGYVVGVVTLGAESFFCKNAQHRAVPGDVLFVNPGEVHDGEPAVSHGYVYRMIYPDVALMRDVAHEILGRAPDGVPAFAAPVVRDPDLARSFTALHRCLDAPARSLAQDEGLIAVVGRALLAHARLAAPRSHGLAEPVAVARARALIETHYAEDLDLERLASAGGLSRFHLVRAFRRATGATPHGYLIDRRVRAARDRLRRGEAVAGVAAACGFADQAHLTRAFKARIGVTPGAFRRAAAA